MEAVPAEMQLPMVLCALEELRMLTQTDIERERYEARRKAQLDHNTWMSEARQEGRSEGEKVGAIHAFERMLNLPLTPREQLLTFPLVELDRLVEELQKQLRQQR